MLNNAKWLLKPSSLEFISYRMKTKFVPKAKIIDEVNEKFDGGLRHRSQPGKRHIPTVDLPFVLERAAYLVIDKYKRPNFNKDVYQLNRRIHFAQLPWEPQEVDIRRKEISEKIIHKEQVLLDTLPEEERVNTLYNRKKRIDLALKSEMAGWKEIVYNEYSSVLYMTARLAPNFAALKAVFNEIKSDVKDFKPETMLDFGSGTGSSMWAAHEIWPNCFHEIVNIDISKDMNHLSHLLLHKGNESNSAQFDGVFYREYLPITSHVKYDLVVSAFSLLELPSLANRVQVLENLWHKTSDMLVLIEHGTRAGFSTILEARNLILQMTGHKVSDTFSIDAFYREVEPRSNDVPQSHIVAPCPHHYPCPRLFTGGPVFCGFEVNFNDLNLKIFPSPHRERYSYIVLRKGPVQFKETPPWPRVVQPVIKGKRRAITRLCTPEGTIKEIIFTKKKDEGHMYRCAKTCKWGDLLPIEIGEREVEVRERKQPIPEDRLLTSKTD